MAINSFYVERYSKNIAGKESGLGNGTVTGGLTAKHKMELVLKTIKKYCFAFPNPVIADFGGAYGSMQLFKEEFFATVKAIKNAFRILKPTGLFIITIPNLASFVNRFSLLFGFMPTNYCPTKKRFGTLFGVKNSSWHKTVLTPRAIKELLSYHGFEVKEIKSFSYSYGKALNLLNTLLPVGLAEGLVVTTKKRD